MLLKGIGNGRHSLLDQHVHFILSAEFLRRDDGPVLALHLNGLEVVVCEKHGRNNQQNNDQIGKARRSPLFAENEKPEHLCEI